MKISAVFWWVAILSTLIRGLLYVAVLISAHHANTTTIEGKLGLRRQRPKDMPAWSLFNLVLWIFWLVLYVSDK